MAVMHPAAKMLVDLSAAQDIEAGDGTTSVAIITGALLGAAERLLAKGIHPMIIAESFQRAALRSVEVLREMSIPIKLSDRDVLIKAASTSLNSKIVSQFSSTLAPMAVDAVLKVIDPNSATNVNLNDIKLIKKVGGTIDDTELVDGLVLTQNAIKSAGGPTRIEKAKIAMIQFQLSPLSQIWRTMLLLTTIDRWIRFLRRNECIFSTCASRSRRPSVTLSLFRSLFSVMP